ncbi:maleylacetoacetate isomerase [Aliidongia dinghuensis]|uniref:Maleylacetoacetate isomerase n=1 Tax=Aliidongia dinghuensis TaxID=1867774 RepID=A0A8J2YWQ8_9PROT|nr:maleylacetoacetate isomerase [Aliidongia dinghuensis]GGF31733.1 maleylacetoacetate isomerase [Aliidongia dinghuensis]
MKLHGYYRSSASFRVRIALNLKGIEYETIPHHLRKGEQRAPDYLKLNPQGFVPVLEDDGELLLQSMAIIEYLDEAYPFPPLLPGHPADRARVRAIAQMVSCDIHPIDNLRVLRYLRHELGHDEATVQRWYNHWIAEGFAALETFLAGSDQTGRFCHGETPTLADVCLVPQVVNSQNFKLDLEPYPTIRRIHEACLGYAAFEDALPKNQPDAE